MDLVYHILQARAALQQALSLCPAADSETKATLRLQRAELDLLLERLAQ